jgi:RNA polymerase sigma-70 factor (ECF subfamily)
MNAKSSALLEAPTIDIHRDIIERCKAGDRLAQQELYGLYSKAMYNTAYRLVNDADGAQDVLQDAFVKAFTRLDQYRFEASFGGWLKRIVVNTALNALRKKRPDLLDNFDEVAEQRIEVVADETEWPVSIERAIAAVETLPDGYRTVFSLYLLEGYDHHEISEILNIKVSTSISQLSRAKKKLKLLILKG